jgi:muramidase (phage lysozyme)
MDANIQAVILGVVSNVLTMFLVSPFEKGEKKHTSFNRIIQKAIEKVADTFEWTGAPEVEEVCLFLTSPEVEAVIRQVFSVKLSESNIKNIELIRQEFVTLFAAHFELKKGKSLTSANTLFTILLDGADAAFDAAIDKGILSAHEAKSIVRYRQILDEIAVVQKNLDFLSSRHKPNVQAILEFEKKYRAQVAERHGRITPPNFDSARRLPINDIYVAPNFAEFCKPKGNRSSEGENNNLTLSNFLAKIYRAILLGNPGGGKSTLTDKLCFDLADKYSERLLAGRQLTPIPVILRDYGAEKKTRNCSILQFIELTANSTYQIQAPEGAFEYLLLNGRVIVIFDGLDELLETSYRKKITADVESFCNLYPSVPILVTSREVGYEQAPLDEKKFEAYRLAPFNEEQITEYVTKWFIADSELTPSQQQQKTESFLKESQIVPDLRSNPLMLALMCNIYRGENYIPQNRPDLYEKCAVMLFERWDKTRGIIVPLPFEAHIRPAMMYLAHWIYTNDALQSGVDEDELISKTADYLLERRYDDRDEAEMAARKFIEFCKGRAWVFTDTGAGLYQFTHRTFLEYFTAFHLVRIHSSPESLISILIKRIAKKEWDIVSQLAIQLLNKFSEGAGDRILVTLVDTASQIETTNTEGWNLISFAARCLNFIIPSSTVRKRITNTCLEHYLNFGRFNLENPIDDYSGREFRHRQEGVQVTLADLLMVTSENHSTVAKAIEDWLTKTVGTDTDINAALAIEILTYLPYSLRMYSYHEPTNEVVWRNLSDKVYVSCKKRIDKLMRKDKAICDIAFWRREIDIKDIINWHGLSSVFTEKSYLIFPLFLSPAHQLLGAILNASSYSDNKGRSPRRKRIEDDFEQIKNLGSFLLSIPPPWVERESRRILRINPYMIDKQFTGGIPKKAREMPLDADTIFGGFAIVATGIEASVQNNGKLPTDLNKALKGSDTILCNLLRWTFLARFEQVDEHLVIEEWDKSRFQDEQRTLIYQWIRREVNFVKLMPRSKSRTRSIKKRKTTARTKAAKKK